MVIYNIYRTECSHSTDALEPLMHLNQFKYFEKVLEAKVLGLDRQTATVCFKSYRLCLQDFKMKIDLIDKLRN